MVIIILRRHLWASRIQGSGVSRVFNIPLKSQLCGHRMWFALAELEVNFKKCDSEVKNAENKVFFDTIQPFWGQDGGDYEGTPFLNQLQ